MRILLISPYFPSEHSGHAGSQLIFRKIKNISNTHEITLVSFFNSKDKNCIIEVKKLGIHVIAIPYERNRHSVMGKIMSIFQNILPLTRSFFGIEIFFISKYNRVNMRNILIKTKSSFKPDLVQFEYNAMHHYADLFPKIPKILVQHDISTKVYERGAKNSQTKFGQRKNRRLFKLAIKSESGWMNKFDHIITLTNEDKEYCQLKWNDLPCISIIPPGINIQGNQKITKNKYELCFVGSFNREPNLQAVEILINDILPDVTKEIPDVNLKIAGMHLPKNLIDKIKRNDKVIYHGFVKDIDSFISESSLFIAPIKIGSGLKMKITHALACGTAVLTTPVGSEGIPLTDIDGLFIEAVEEKLIRKCIRLLQNPESLAEIGSLGRLKVRKIFSNEIIGKKYNNLYRKMMTR